MNLNLSKGNFSKTVLQYAAKLLIKGQDLRFMQVMLSIVITFRKKTVENTDQKAEKGVKATSDFN